jgi:uncharacterized protein YlxW (UPF0749 family)
VNANDEWILKEHLPRIRRDEVDCCCQYIKDRECPVLSSELTCNVLKCSPESPKSELFKFSVDYHLQLEPDLVKYDSPEGIKWDIKRALPPRLIRNTLSSDAISFGFIKITKGLRELLEYCGTSERVIFKTYGEYEIVGDVDTSLQRVYGEDLRRWYLENDLKPDDIIYIKTPDSPDGYPILYTAFERKARKTYSDEKKREVGRKANLRHRIYTLLAERNEYLHLKEIQKQIENALQQTLQLQSLAAVLSANTHLFRRLPRTRGLWGLSRWETEARVIDSISLSLAIREEDWVVVVLQEFGQPLSVIEIAEKLSSVFITPKDKILEINFFDPGDERLVQLNGKWALKTWVDEWQKKHQDIGVKVSDYHKLSEELNRLRLDEKALQTKVTRLEDAKSVAKEKLASANEMLDKAATNISELSQKKLRCEQKLLDLSNEKIQSIQIELTISASILLLGVIFSIFLLYYTYVIIGVAGVLATVFMASYFMVRALKSKRQSEQRSQTMDNLNKMISSYGDQIASIQATREKIQKVWDNYSTKLQATEQAVQDILSKLKSIANQIRLIEDQMNAIDLQKLMDEKKQLAKLLNL